MEQLGDDQVGDLVVDRRAEKDDPVVQQAREQVEGAIAAVGRLDDGGDENAGHAVAPTCNSMVAHTYHATCWLHNRYRDDMERIADFDVPAEDLWEVVADAEGLASWFGD